MTEVGVSAAASSPDTVVIVAVVLLNAALGLAQEYRAERAIQTLKALVPPKDGCDA